MCRLRSTALASMLAIVVGVGAIPALAASGTIQPTNGRWTLAHWNRPSGGGALGGISATSPTDVWAVGGLYFVGGLVEHWNGRAWERVQAPRYQQLGAVAAVTPTDAWAVGARGDGCTSLPVIEHWNGQRWSTMAAVTTPGSGVGELNSMSADSPSDIWAVGEFTPHGTVCDGPPPKDIQRTRPLISHWNGHQWLVSDASPRGTGLSLVSVAALSPTNVWAVGNESVHHNGYRGIIEHWNGRTWRVVPSLHPGPRGRGFLRSMSAVGPHDIWAVGYYSASRTRQHTFVERWNGSVWRQIPSPNRACHLNEFSSISMLSPTDGWAVGDGGYCSDPSETSEAAHWNGMRWSMVPTENTGARGTYLGGVVTISHRVAWAVGQAAGREGTAGFGIIERYRP